MNNSGKVICLMGDDCGYDDNIIADTEDISIEEENWYDKPKFFSLIKVVSRAIEEKNTSIPFQRQHSVVSELPTIAKDIVFPEIPVEPILLADMENTAILNGNKWSLNGNNTKVLTSIVPYRSESEISMVFGIETFDEEEITVEWGSHGARIISKDAIGTIVGGINLDEDPVLSYPPVFNESYLVFHDDKWKFFSQRAHLYLESKNGTWRSVEGKIYGLSMHKEGFYEVEVGYSSELWVSPIRRASYAMNSQYCDRRIQGIHDYSVIYDRILRVYRTYQGTSIIPSSTWFDPYVPFFRLGQERYNEYCKSRRQNVWIGKIGVPAYRPKVKHIRVENDEGVWTNTRPQRCSVVRLVSKKKNDNNLPVGLWYKND